MERFVLEFAIRSSLIVLTAALVLRFLRIKIAAAQHTVWVGVLLVMLALPIWMSWGPKATLPVLPARTATRIVATHPPALRAAAPVIPAPSPAAVPLNMPGPRKVAETSEAKSPVWSWNGILIGAYLLGACTLLLRLAIGTLRVSRLTSASCVVPVTVGLLRPRIILPESCREWPQAQLDAVLTHEGTHVRRRDPLFQWLALFNRAVFWFHPLTWWLERRLSALAEEACDDAVLERGHDPREYAEYLLDLARAVQRTGTRVNALSMAMPGSYLPQRVRKMIEGVRAPRISPMRMACAAVACAIPAAVLIAGTFDPASPQQGSSASTGAPRFEVADVHRTTRVVLSRFAEATGGDGRPHFGQYVLHKRTILELIERAYDIEPDKVLGGPMWLELGQYEIAAKVSDSTPPETLRLMLQALLADRFKLVIHKDTKPMPALALRLEKGELKLKQTESSDTTGGCEIQRKAFGEPQGNPVIISCRNITMSAFGEWLHGRVSAYVNKPVVDMTDLKGGWDFDLKWNAAWQQVGMGLVPRSIIFDAIDKQLGLKLESQNVPTPVLVIDHVNEDPIDNPPGVAQKIPSPPTEFEVAAIKPTNPQERSPSPYRWGSGFAFDPGGQIQIRAVPMNYLIATAWDISYMATTDQMFAGAPKWVDSAQFDIVAKTAPGQIGGFEIRPMLRTLLIDRFRMVTHYEDRLMPAYELVATHPKLRKADPSRRTSCSADSVMDVNPTLSRVITCQNITMEQFADQLRRLALDYTHYTEVFDATGIKGAWDFTLNFSPSFLLLQNAARRNAEPSDGPADPDGAVSLFDALNKQLGLKLEMRKHMLPMLVIDHMDEKPTEN